MNQIGVKKIKNVIKLSLSRVWKCVSSFLHDCRTVLRFVNNHEAGRYVLTYSTTSFRFLWSSNSFRPILIKSYKHITLTSTA